MSSAKYKTSKDAIRASTRVQSGLLKSLNKIYELHGENDSAVARKLGVPAAQFNQWRTGIHAPSRPAVKFMAQAFGVSEEDFLSGRVNETPEHYGIDPLTPKSRRLIERFRKFIEYAQTEDPNLLTHFETQIDAFEKRREARRS